MTRLRVLVVDDHPLVREGVIRVLDDEHDIRVVGWADSLDTARRKLRELPVDVIVLDLALGPDDGMALLREVQNGATQSVVVLTMFNQPMMAVRALQAGAAGYVLKEDPPEDTVVAVRKASQGQIHITPRMASEVIQRLAGRNPRSSGLDDLTDRELQIYRLLGEGHTVRDIATELEISAKTVESHRQNVIRKLGLSGSHELLHHAIAWHLRHGHGAPGGAPA
ncbi:MAG: response regulator transcription factor [Longimicrobiales bacterium]